MFPSVIYVPFCMRSLSPQELSVRILLTCVLVQNWFSLARLALEDILNQDHPTPPHPKMSNGPPGFQSKHNVASVTVSRSYINFLDNLNLNRNYKFTINNEL